MRKYQIISGYMVYAHITPNGLYYIGISKQQPCKRWQPKLYKDTILAPYTEQYGWENIEHKVLCDGLTKKEAEQWEDRIIQALSMNGLCINKQRSGGYARDDTKTYMQVYYKQYRQEHKEELKAYKKDYNKQYHQEHKEGIKAYKKQYDKQRLSTPEGKIYNRVKSYNQRHTPIETPMEAKQRYLATGYIPNYIKNNDL